MPSSRRGTGFVNLQQYLGLNQGGAQALGAGLAGDLNQKRQGVQNGIDMAAMGAKNKALEGMPEPGGTYKGPNSFGDAADVGLLTAQVAEAQKQAIAAQSQTGRAELLAQKYGQGTWGGGQLDSALVGAGGSAGQIGAVADGVGRLNQYLGNTTSDVNAYIADAKTLTKHPSQMPSAAAPTAPARMGAPPAIKDQRKRDDLDRYGYRP